MSENRNYKLNVKVLIEIKDGFYNLRIFTVGNKFFKQKLYDVTGGMYGPQIETHEILEDLYLIEKEKCKEFAKTEQQINKAYTYVAEDNKVEILAFEDDGLFALIGEKDGKMFKKPSPTTLFLEKHAIN